ncbi:peptide chain release factor-like protein [bacterium]|nr:MAG: peptide chain release factor-like protein [bacterium]
MDKVKALPKGISGLGIAESEIIEKFVKSRGPGGQNVNKTATCVYLKHIPTGIEVKCQRERSQVLNRYIARQLLFRKVRELSLSILNKEKQLKARLRRQQRPRSKKAKLLMLQEKRVRSQKKLSRRPLRGIEE